MKVLVCLRGIIWEFRKIYICLNGIYLNVCPLNMITSSLKSNWILYSVLKIINVIPNLFRYTKVDFI